MGFFASICIQSLVGFGQNWIQSIGYRASLRPVIVRWGYHAQALASTTERTGCEARTLVV
jgi:hypothetical protein